MRKINLRPVILLLLPALLSVGCGLGDVIPGSDPEPPATRTPMPTFTATPAGAAFVDAVAPENQPIEQQQPQEAEF